MSEWIYESELPSGEVPSPNTGYRWKYNGEVLLSLYLGRSSIGSRIGRFEVTRIFDNPDIARALASDIDKEAAIATTSRGEEFVDEPFWYGYSPNQLKGFCKEYRLPLPSGYAKYWRSFRTVPNP